jgi:hypothetical protein
VLDDQANAIAKRALEAFAPRGLRLVEVEESGPGQQRLKFDLIGHRLHLVTDERDDETFVLELRDALHISEDLYPGALATTLELINYLHAHVHYARFLMTDVSSSPQRWFGVGSVSPEYLNLSPEAVAPRDALVSVVFTAPLFGGGDQRWRDVFELGIDVLLYALGRLHDELHSAGFPIAGMARAS